MATVFLASALLGCGGPSSVSLPDNSNGIRASCSLGETVKACVDKLASSFPQGGTLMFDTGVYPSGYQGSDRITTAHITLQGAGMPAYNSDLTALSGGTIITGTLPVVADYFAARDLGIDVGSQVVPSGAVDGFAMANVGQLIGRPPFKAPVLENITVLGVNRPGAHSVLVENVTGARIHNLRCRFQTHCFAFKGSGIIEKVDAAGGSTDNIVIKSDFYAPTSDVAIFHVTMTSITPGDSGGLVLEALDADMKHIAILDVVGKNIRYGLHLDAADPSTISDIYASGLTFDNSGYASSDTYCLAESGSNGGSHSINGFRASNISCRNFGQVQNINNQSVQNGALFNIRGFNILGDAFWNSGTWNMLNISLKTVSGNGVVALGGLTTIEGSSFDNLSGSPFVEAGGEIRFGLP